MEIIYWWQSSLSGRNSSHRHWNCWLIYSLVVQILHLGRDSETETGKEKKGLVWDYKEMPVLKKSHGVMSARNKSYVWDLWEVERTVQPTGQEKRWGIRGKISLGVRDACLMCHWGYWGCMCPWQWHECIRTVKSRHLAQPQKHAVQGSVFAILWLWSRGCSPEYITTVSSDLGFCYS